VVLALFGWLIWTRPSFLTGLTRSRLLIWNALFVLALTLMQLFHQVSFPIKESAYPLAAPSNAAWRHVPLAFVLLLFPVLFVDFILLLEAYKAFRPTPRALARGFGVASLFLLIMVLAHVFTTTYDYIPVVGPLFRDKFWLVYLLLGVVLLLAMIAVDKRVYGRRLKETATNAGRVNSWLVVAFGFAAILGTLVTTARPVSQPADNRSLKLLTYNIQQGYSLDGQRNYDGQLELIRDTDPDLIGLQETDNARISGGNNDVVRYMADKLDMYSYYGPKTVVGTFGIALLSKVPIESPRTHYLYSEGEQVAVIEAQISSGSRTFIVFVIHHGNCGDGPQWQQPEFLQLVNGKENVLVMGDHNFRPVARPSAECSRDDHELYGQTVSILDDVVPVNEKGDRIDHIFVSPDLQYRDSRYIDSSASDHPALTTIIEW
jgi:endonuclease/exonuclease/phosphatase family metal-dependent hydrolase